VANLLAFCEAPSDFAIASTLVDRVLQERVRWVRETLTEHPEAVRSWHQHRGAAFLKISDARAHLQALGGRVPHGRFNGETLREELFARTVFLVARALAQSVAEPIHAIVVTRDVDNDGERVEGFKRARKDAQAWNLFRIAIGLADLARESWVLAGFEAEGDAEVGALEAFRQDLGFWPNEEPQQLDSSHAGAKRDPKRVLRALVGDDRDREERCFVVTPLTTLRRRGAKNGLGAFLNEIEEHIVPLFDPE
jgi:hypothetical protein